MKKIIAIILIIFLMYPKTGIAKQFDNLREEAEETINKTLKITPVYVSLDECLAITILNNFDLRSASEMFESYKWNFRNALSFLLPQAGLAGYLKKYKGQILVGGVLTDTFNEVAAYGGYYVTYDLTQGGKIIFDILSKKEQRNSQNFKLKQTEQDVLYKTAFYYYKLLTIKLEVENYLRNQKELQWQYDITNAHYEVGSGEKFDVLRTEVQLKQAEIELNTYIKEFRLTQFKLANVMGVEITIPLMPIEREVKEYQIFDITKDMEEVYKQALTVNNSILAEEKQIAYLKEERKKNYSDFIPKADIFLRQSYQGTLRLGLNPNLEYGINLDIPLGKNLTAGTITKLKAMNKEIEAKELALEQKKRDLKEKIYNAYIETLRSAKRISLCMLQLELAKKTTEIAQGKLFEGDGNLLDTIQAQSEKTRISVELSKAKVNYNIYQIELLYASGLLSIDKLLNGYSP